MKKDAKNLRNLLEEILDEIPDDRETGLMLSGGLDSSAVACILLSTGRKLRSISASFRGFPLYNETEYVEMIKEKYPHLETNYFTPLDINLLDELEKLMEIIRTPIKSGSPLLQYLLMKRAKELGMKLLIYCQWPDELMGGYSPFLLDRARDDLLHLRLSDATINITEYTRRSKMVKTNLIFPRIIKKLLVSKGLKRALHESIPNLEHLIDIAQKTAEAVGVQLILPYGDPRVISFCQPLNTDRLVNKGQTKIILREAVADIAPEGIVKRRRKLGFPSPEAIWLAKNKKSIEALKDKEIRREYKNFLKNKNKMTYGDFWVALSNFYLRKL
jgi:asparagine synthase (glutamine-hydrolysing)